MKNPIPGIGLEGIWQKIYENEAATATFILPSYGGRMSEIAESSIPSHIELAISNIYKIQHLVSWSEEENALPEKYVIGQECIDPL